MSVQGFLRRFWGFELTLRVSVWVTIRVTARVLRVKNLGPRVQRFGFRSG